MHNGGRQVAYHAILRTILARNKKIGPISPSKEQVFLAIVKTIYLGFNFQVADGPVSLDGRMCHVIFAVRLGSAMGHRGPYLAGLAPDEVMGQATVIVAQPKSIILAVHAAVRKKPKPDALARRPAVCVSFSAWTMLPELCLMCMRVDMVMVCRAVAC